MAPGLSASQGSLVLCLHCSFICGQRECSAFSSLLTVAHTVSNTLDTYIYIGEGNGSPLQYSCLENPVDGGAWWAVSIGSHRVGHDWNDLACMHAYIYIFKLFFFRLHWSLVWHMDSLLLHASFFWLQRIGATLPSGVQASHYGGCSDFGACTLGHRLQELQYTGLVVPRQGESSQTRDWTHDPELADRFLTTGSPRKLLHFILQCDTHTFTHTHFHTHTHTYTSCNRVIHHTDLPICNALWDFLFYYFFYSIFFNAGHGLLNWICHSIMGCNWKILVCKYQLFVLIFHFNPESFQIGNLFGILHFDYFELLISEAWDT